MEVKCEIFLHRSFVHVCVDNCECSLSRICLFFFFINLVLIKERLEISNQLDNWNARYHIDKLGKNGFQKSASKTFVTRCTVSVFCNLNIRNFANFTNSGKSFYADILESVYFEKM